jgi:hypothetical protein
MARCDLTKVSRAEVETAFMSMFGQPPRKIEVKQAIEVCRKASALRFEFEVLRCRGLGLNLTAAEKE